MAQISDFDSQSFSTFSFNEQLQNNELELLLFILNTMFRFRMIPAINKPTRVIRQTGSAIDYIITNSIIHSGFKSGIIKTDISDQFPIFFLL